MDNKNNNGIIIFLLIIIIAIIGTLCILFATGTISLNTKKGSEVENNTKENTQVIEDTDDNDDSTEDNQVVDYAYSEVIEEYKKAISNENYKDYTYVNGYAMTYYFQDRRNSFNYTKYDINKDGNSELIILFDNYIVDVFTNDGSKSIRLFGDRAGSLVETRSKITLYDDGLIYVYGSNGAEESSMNFYTIKNNTLNVKNSYVLKYLESVLSVYDKDGNKLNYTKIDEVINDNAKGNKIEITDLSWNIIK